MSFNGCQDINLKVIIDYKARLGNQKQVRRNILLFQIRLIDETNIRALTSFIEIRQNIYPNVRV